MKTIITSILLASLFVGCAGNQQKPVLKTSAASGAYVAKKDMRSVRHPESVKAYSHGRYVDPNDKDIMYPEGEVYRVEEDSAWNLEPEPLPQRGPATSHEDPAAVETALTAEFEQELQKLQQERAIIMEQNDALIKQRQIDVQAIKELKDIDAHSRKLARDLENLKTDYIVRNRELEEKLKAPQPEPPKPASKQWWEIW